MNEVLFLQSLYSLDYAIGRATRRRSLLLLHDAICHGKIEKFLQYLFLQIRFLPKRTTSIPLPLDAGIITCIKRKYKKRLSMRAIDPLDAGYLHDLYIVDLNLAIDWINDLWYRLQHSIIRNCWAKTRITDRM